MALSNLIWWPWFGIGSQAPPAPGQNFLVGDSNPSLIPNSWGQPRRSRRRIEEEEDEIIAVVTDVL